MSSLSISRHIFSLAITLLLLTRSIAAQELPSGAKLLEDKTVMYMRPVPLVSPDGRLVAYVNRGYVCVADLEDGTTRRLAEVPGTWSHYYANVDGTTAGGDADSLPRTIGGDWTKHVKAEISDFQWTRASDAIAFRLTTHDIENKTSKVLVRRVPIEGDSVTIASAEHPVESRRMPGGLLTADGRFLVANHGGRVRALIWDVATNNPCATPFDYLTPSPTSGRWLGVEKDTRELVLVDENFNVTRRYAEILPKAEYGFDMIWSPDERFVFWRQRIGFDYYSNWVGCRYDLQTANREIFTGDYMNERIAFTGNRSEILRIGKTGAQRHFSGLDEVERYIALVPEGRPCLRRLWHRRADDPHYNKDRGLGGHTPVVWSPDFQFFIFGLPRQEGPHGEVMYLLDRQRQLWRLPGAETSSYPSPYSVAGFAQNGKSIIAYTSTQLFALPLESIQTAANRVRPDGSPFPDRSKN